jgi:hypothetical protein
MTVLVLLQLMLLLGVKVINAVLLRLLSRLMLMMSAL